MKRNFILIALASLFLTACDVPSTLYMDGKGTVHNVRIHAEWEFDSAQGIGNVDPPTRLDAIMHWDYANPITKDSAVERCEKMGGEPIYYPKTKQLMCQGIDY
jgi:hypothetical protein